MGSLRIPMRLLLAALGLVFVMLAGAPAYADCFESCQNSCKNLSGQITSQACVDTCARAYCNKPSVSFGAIAYGASSTANGFSYGKGSKGDAEGAALSFCRQHGNDCKIVASFSNVCAAVAAVESKNVFSTGQGATRDQAQARAMSSCTAQHGGGCEIEVWTCAQP